jgi:aspartyl-tRNA(Asn)/glutamyl-tRNA(Gln) amidotransferase subunit C
LTPNATSTTIFTMHVGWIADAKISQSARGADDSEMAVTRETVERLAEMTRIGLRAEEVDRLTGDMEAILDHVGRLQQVDTSTVHGEGHGPNLGDVTRPDVVGESLATEDALANAPERKDDFFVVPAVFGE